MSVTSLTELSHLPEAAETFSIASSKSSLFGESKEVEQINIKEDLKTYRSFVSQERRQNWKKYLGTVALGVAGLALVFFGIVALNPFMVGVGLGLSMYSVYKYFKIDDKAKADGLESFKLYDRIRLIKAESSSENILQPDEATPEQHSIITQESNPLASKPVHTITLDKDAPGIDITSKEGRKKYDNYISKMRKKSWAQYLKSGVVGVSGVALIFFGALALNPFMIVLGIGLTSHSLYKFWSIDDKAKDDALEKYRKDEALSYRQEQVMVLMRQTMVTLENRASQGDNFSVEGVVDSAEADGEDSTLVTQLRDDEVLANEAGEWVEGDVDGLVSRASATSLASSLERTED